MECHYPVQLNQHVAMLLTFTECMKINEALAQLRALAQLVSRLSRGAVGN